MRSSQFYALEGCEDRKKRMVFFMVFFLISVKPLIKVKNEIHILKDCTLAFKHHNELKIYIYRS